MTIPRKLSTILMIVVVGGFADRGMAAEDRVICGFANLSTMSKLVPDCHLENEALRKVLQNSKLSVAVIQERMVSSGEPSKSAPEYSLLYVNGRETKFRRIKVSATDYAKIVDLADKLHKE